MSFCTKKQIISILVIVSLVFGPHAVFAVPPTGGYAPGETLDPTCSPGDADCIVRTLTAQDEGVDLLGNVLKLNFTGSGVSSSIASGVVAVNIAGSQWLNSGSDIYFDTGNVGIGTDAPRTALDVSGMLPVEVGSIAVNSNPRSLAIDGNHIYIASDSLDSFEVFDVSNPTSPINIGDTTITSSADFISIKSQYAFVGSEVVDISDPSNPSVLSSFAFGPGTGIVLGKYLYGIERFSDELKIFDISELTNIGLVDSIATGDYPGSIQIKSYYAYVTNLQSDTLQIFDVSDPSNPVSVGSVATGDGPFDISLQGRYAYVLNNGSATLQIFDVSDPTTPVSVGSVATGSAPYGLSVQGHYAYVTNLQSDTLQIFDVSDPSNPVSVGSVATGDGPFDISLQGRYAYVLNNGSATLQIFDLSGAYIQNLEAGSLEASNIAVQNNIDAQTLNLRGSLNVGIGGILSQGPVAIQSQFGSALEVVGQSFFDGNVGIGTDTPHTSAILDLSSTTLGLLTPRMTEAERDAITTPATGLLVFNTSTNAFNFFNGTSWQTVGGTPSQWTTVGDDIYFNTGNVGIGTDTPRTALDVSGFLPVEVGSVATGTSPREVFVDGGHAYVLNFNSSTLEVFDITDPTTPTEVGSVATGSNPYGIFIQGEYAYVVRIGSDTIEVFDISDPTTPTSVGSVATGDAPADIVIQGYYAYVVNALGNTLEVFDITDPTTPTEVGSVATGSNPYGIFIQGRYAYVTNNTSNTLEVFDILDPTTPTEVGSVATGTGPYGISIQGEYAYVVNTGGTLQIFDISDPTTPTSVGSVATGSNSQEIFVQGRYAYVTNNSSNTLQIFDISDPTTPTSVGSVATGTGPNGITIQGRYIYVVNTTSNTLQVFNIAGAYIQNLEVGSFDAVNIAVQNNIDAQTLNLRGSLNVGIGGIFSQGPVSIVPGDIGTEIALRVGGAAVADGGAVLRLRDVNSTCDFNADTGSPSCGSDETLKKDIVSIEGSLVKISGLRPVTYHWLTDGEDAPLQHGFIAQEVEAVFPHLVSERQWVDGSTRKFLNTGGMIPYLVGAINDMYTEIKTNLVTKKIQVQEELCVGAVCVTEAQFMEVFGAGVSAPEEVDVTEETPMSPLEDEENVVQNAQEEVTEEAQPVDPDYENIPPQDLVDTNQGELESSEETLDEFPSGE